MNLIETNVIDLRGRIHALAQTQASLTSPVAKVRVSGGVGFTVADLLDLEASEDGRYARVTVVNPSAVRNEIAELRRDASPVVRRMFSAFIKGLAEAETDAQRTHLATIASKMEEPLMGNRMRQNNDRPLAGHSVSNLVNANNEIVEFLTNGSFSLRDDESGSDYFSTLTGFGVTGGTSIRFKVINGVPTQQYRHTLAVNGYNATNQIMENCFTVCRHSSDPAMKIMVTRHNSLLLGASQHIILFLELVLLAIETELEARVAECNQAGLGLVVTKTPAVTPAVA